jgi:hypothetical protein|tara:strand:- start:63 stop:479 length:417 start_codon:yes stop_codon:yes gene_type:complete
MSAMKFQIGEPKKLTLAFDEPKTGTNSYGAWYMYGVKSDINSDKDCFFATESLHAMIKTLGAREGDEITIEKCQEGEIVFFKVNGLTLNEMNSGGSAEKIAEASPTSEVDKLKARIKELESELSSYRDSKLTDADIPF